MTVCNQMRARNECSSGEAGLPADRSMDWAMIWMSFSQPGASGSPNSAQLYG